MRVEYVARAHPTTTSMPWAMEQATVTMLCELGRS
jgi:hypothetical protein